MLDNGRNKVGVLRIERRTSVLSGQRSNRLSYTPEKGFILAHEVGYFTRNYSSALMTIRLPSESTFTR